MHSPSRPQALVLKDSSLSLGARQTRGSGGIRDMKLKRWLGVTSPGRSTIDGLGRAGKCRP